MSVEPATEAIAPAAGSLRALARRFAGGSVKAAAYYSGLHHLVFYRYDYMFRPAQLCLLCQLLSDTESLDGPVVEIGVAAGHTTVFLNKHLDDLGSSRSYVCIDTFEGFTEADVAVERERGNPDRLYANVFRNNKEHYLRRTLRNNSVDRVRIIKSDVAAIDPGVFDGASFCLIDVDLYAPVAAALRAALPRMAPGGVVVVDDCVSVGAYEGAYVAYIETIRALGLEPDIRCGKLGVIRAGGVSSPVCA